MIKKILAAILIVLALGGSALAYSWWDNLSQTQNETISVGQGITLTVAAVAVAPAGKYLVPDGVVLKINDVESIVLTYNVKLDLTALDALNLSIVAEEIKIGGDATYANLVIIEIVQASSTVNNTNVLVTVTVTLAQPATVVEYNLIKNMPITFNLKFTATQQ
jgi:hypothetical protein